MTHLKLGKGENTTGSSYIGVFRSLGAAIALNVALVLPGSAAADTHASCEDPSWFHDPFKPEKEPCPIDVHQYIEDTYNLTVTQDGELFNTDRLSNQHVFYGVPIQEYRGGDPVVFEPLHNANFRRAIFSFPYRVVAITQDEITGEVTFHYSRYQSVTFQRSTYSVIRTKGLPPRDFIPGDIGNNYLNGGR